MHPPNARAAILLLIFGMITVATPIIAMLLAAGSPATYFLRGVTVTAGLAQVVVVLLMYLVPVRPVLAPSDSRGGLRSLRAPSAVDE